MSVTENIVCKDFVEEVTNYLEGKLSEAEKHWTEEHLAQCDACVAYLAQMRATITALKGLRETEFDPELRERILSQLP